MAKVAFGHGAEAGQAAASPALHNGSGSFAAAGAPCPGAQLVRCTGGGCYCFFFTLLWQRLIFKGPVRSLHLYGRGCVNKRLNSNKIKIILKKPSNAGLG